MNKVDLLMDELKKKFYNMGFGSQDPVINNVLGVLSKASMEAKSQADIAMVMGRLETLINLEPEILMNRLKMRIGKANREAELMDRFYKEREEELEIEEDRIQDNEQNQDLIDLVEQRKVEEEQKRKEDELEDEQELFLLDTKGKSPRLQVREELEERSLQDRQKALMERSLRILEALEKIKDAMKQEKGMLEIGGDFFKGLDVKQIKQQLGLLKAMGVQGITKDENGNIVENDGREVSAETITEKDIEALEKGEVDFAIPFETLQSIGWKQQDEKLRQWFKDKGIELDENEPTIIKGLEDATKEGPEVQNRRFDDDEGR